MKRLTLCADDFALSPAVSRGILDLLERGRLSAVSVMSESPLWPALAAPLAAGGSAADLGLHLDLTEPFSPRARPLAWWLLASQARLLPRAGLGERLLRQIDRFAEHLGRLPDFIDGHQHVHAFPVIREALFEAIARRWGAAPRPYLRAPDRLASAGDDRLKGRLLRCACAGYHRRAQNLGFATPQWFAGLYSLRPQADYPRLMAGWLAACPDGGLLMCHPGLYAAAGDPIGAARAAEYRFLASPAFAEQCRLAGVTLGRFAGRPAPANGQI